MSKDTAALVVGLLATALQGMSLLYIASLDGRMGRVEERLMTAAYAARGR